MYVRAFIVYFALTFSFFGVNAAVPIENDNWRNSFNGMGAGPVYDSLIEGDNFFVAGPNNAGGFVAPGVARWAGSQWKADPVVGATGYATALAASQNGVL